MKIDTVGLCCGFAESQQIACTVFESQALYFESVDEALDSLARFLFDLFKSLGDGIQPSCSPGVDHRELDTNFCPDCGASLINEVSKEMFEEFIKELSSMTLGSYPGYFEEDSWTPSFERNSSTEDRLGGVVDLLIEEEAEKLLSARVFND